ncbi:MAG: hypothetical protein AVDCRST_MAG70-891 [uncultured Thermomicrobiales bacterium]|uniref:Uncharacterized protein n=1 Tax=uncultured Thermomicrobiales bacterium TaxID=1645740 RepID=A0A6J4UKX0_9BACT|nr:MAG: hypothetical protein AVDCRST_MAG70-891 [uncultured Thermomicrobiales bacterium]
MGPILTRPALTDPTALVSSDWWPFAEAAPVDPLATGMASEAK